MECAGFLKKLDCEVDMLVRSRVLSTIDNQISDDIRSNMNSIGIKFFDKASILSLNKL